MPLPIGQEAGWVPEPVWSWLGIKPWLSELLTASLVINHTHVKFLSISTLIVLTAVTFNHFCTSFKERRKLTKRL
jgi:hypothetical protein